MQKFDRVLSIAGLDPSAGAGLLADIKTFEAHRVYGLGVCSCITYQNEKEISGLCWVTADEIIEQLKPLFKEYNIGHVKIGVIQNIETLEKVIAYLQSINPGIKIVWDPILKSSSGFEFHHKIDRHTLRDLCNNLFLITPNFREIKHLFPEMPEEDAGIYLSEFCAVLLKGGHSGKTNCTDFLFTNGEVKNIESQRLEIDKHGTGCVLSSAITANLANGLTLPAACEAAKQYVIDFLQSDPGLVGHHSYENAKIYS